MDDENEEETPSAPSVFLTQTAGPGINYTVYCADPVLNDESVMAIILRIPQYDDDGNRIDDQVQPLARMHPSGFIAFTRFLSVVETEMTQGGAYVPGPAPVENDEEE